MAEKEIILQGEDGQVDELVLTTQDQASCNSLEDCVRMLFPQEGETAPRLRFKGFDGKWEKRLLSDCLEISEEKNTDNVFGVEDVLSVSDDYGVVNQIEHLGRSYAGKSVSGYKILRPGQIVYTKSPLRAKPYGIVKVNRGKAGIVSVLYAVYNTKEGVAPEYIHYYFDPAWRLNAYMRPLVNKGAKNTMNISDETALTGYIMIPNDIDEQRKIASFLQRLDEQVKHYQEQFDQLKQLKSACLETMFPQKDTAVPSLRFKEFDGAWGEDKLSTYATRITRKNDKMESDLPLTISSSEGLIAQTAFFNNVVASSNMSGYYLLKKGEFAYNKSYSNGYPFGAVKKLEKYEQGALSPLYIVFSLSESVDHDYIVYFFETDLWHKEVAKRAAEGARNHGLLNIGAEDFLDINITFPVDKKEQEQIASFFRKLDAQIISQQQQLERLKQMKQSCLGLLFADNQSITPPLRFKGFSGGWKSVILMDIMDRYDNLRVPVKESQRVKGEYPYYGANGIQDYVDGYTHDGEFILIAEDGANNLIEYPVQYVNGKVWVNNHAHVLSAKKNVASNMFLKYAISHADVKSVLVGGTRAKLTSDALMKLSVIIPPTINEQCRIASFFSSLDEQIKIQTQQVEKLKQMKKACLNQFIA